jgi:site-specific recombinase XerD
VSAICQQFVRELDGTSGYQTTPTGHGRGRRGLLSLAERLGLRRVELCRVRISDINFSTRTVEVWGKGDKYRTMPIPPALFELIEIYL